ncbi:TlpA family protein disulfide reductase [Alteripontixanthobacter muriae]|uniref:TlpA family protein disulfide reductase n=1 Tax=Alteripontixanthobacter muriae TaxID=2705546 RepID=UPI001E65D103|nr:TlpA family protein disulfide reductase [Alteripontixanthobacter muriae]
MPCSLSFKLFASLALVAGLAACDSQGGESAQEQAELREGNQSFAGEVDRSGAGALMPAVGLTNPDGRTLNLGALQGTPVLLNVWATWCAPCVREMPLLDDLAGDYDGEMRVIAASQDLQGAEKVVPFFEETGLSNLEPWIDSETQLSFAFGGQLPVTILYDAQGREVWRILGEYDWSSEEARALIEEGLGRNAA